jgi:hypothetical protein
MTERSRVLETIFLKEFQQPINCCNITSLAYAFSVVSDQISVNDVFHMAKLPADFVVLDGMTLAETFVAATDVAAQMGGVFVENYHFDPELVDFDSFKQAIIDDTGDTDDQLICNFSVKIAHNRPAGGGHFALVGGYEAAGDDIRVTMCDVHPMKYGHRWQCSGRDLFNAMVDKDGDANRSRGMIRVGRSDAARGLPGFEAAKRAVFYAHLDHSRDQSEWLRRFGALPPTAFQMVLNLGGATSAALALTGLTRDIGSDIYLPDDIMWQLRLDYTSDLAEIDTPQEVAQLINEFATSRGLPVSAETVALPKSADALFELLAARLGPAGKTDLAEAHRSEDTVAPILFDLNTAIGTQLIYVDPESEAAKLSHFSNHWAVAIDTNPKDRTVTIADPRSKITTRLWDVKIDDLFDAIQATGAQEIVSASRPVG